MPDFGADSDEDMDGGGAKGGEEGGAPSSMIVQFATLEGENKGPQIDVPLGSTVLQMEELMNQLLENKDKVWNVGFFHFFLNSSHCFFFVRLKYASTRHLVSGRTATVRTSCLLHVCCADCHRCCSCRGPKREHYVALTWTF